tara:strand:- start:292 stop:540 length:249 start_codon:yes stop_codon:yes gene_type:complete
MQILNNYTEIVKAKINYYYNFFEENDFGFLLRFSLFYAMYFCYFTGMVLSYYLIDILYYSYLPFKIVYNYIKKRMLWKKKLG